MELLRGFIKTSISVTCDVCGAQVMEYYTDGKRVLCPSCARKLRGE